jgi:predicted tellurium resistance membrane protein TerC
MAGDLDYRNRRYHNVHGQCSRSGCRLPGNLFLLIFGLGLSIPFVVFTSNLLAMLMDKYPFLVYVGAAILGRVGGEMLITDSFIIQSLHPSHMLNYGVQIFCTIGVIIAGKLWIKIMKARTVAGR